MCLIALALGVHPRWPLVLLANRDEFHARPSAPAAPWAEDPRILGGRDLLAGGTWLAVRADGRFAAVANLRGGGPARGRRSRGELVADFVRGEDPPSRFLARVASRLADYAPFNLIVGDGEELRWLCSAGPRAGRLGPGLHAFANTPPGERCPKCRRLLEALGARLASGTAASRGAAGAPRRSPTAPRRRASPRAPGRVRRRRGSSRRSWSSASDYGTRASTLLLRRCGRHAVLPRAAARAPRPVPRRSGLPQRGRRLGGRVIGLVLTRPPGAQEDCSGVLRSPITCVTRHNEGRTR
ncbi:MAG: NRDE family protein [Xanthomonadales bacterium]|nr:NRDE family protein [Xanthomonadales bacterium]